MLCAFGCVVSLALLGSVAAQVPAAAASTQPAAEWIWVAGETRGEQRVALRRSFTLPAAVRSGMLAATCDNRFTLFLDGRRLLAGSDWSKLETTSKLPALQAGAHVLAVEGRNEGGPAGFLLRLDLQLADGSQLRVVSDATWHGRDDVPKVPAWRTGGGDDGFVAVRSFGPSAKPQGPWADPFVPRVATAAETLTVRDGFRVELVRSADLGEGSWVALDFEPSGHLLVAIERGPLARIVADADGTRFVPLPETPTDAMGFVHAFGALWVQGIGARGRGLYRLRDVDGDGRYEESTQMVALGAGGEHGTHAVVPGPDGMIYLLNGNHSPLPAKLAAASPHRHWAEDVLLPRIEDPRGHAKGIRAPGGHLLRISPEGGDAEIVAAGMRNAYDFAFAPNGEAFTYDSDMEWDIGLPWYRPTRICHLVSGSEFGWRSGASKWPPLVTDAWPAAVDVGLGSPTGVVFGTKARFPARYRDALFVGEWAYGRILAVHLTPQGASYTGSYESFVTGKPLSVTDMVIGPDGAMWFTTGGRGGQSGLYRVVYDGAIDAAPTTWSTNAAIVARRTLEKMHRTDAPGTAAQVWPSLGDRDAFLRGAARVALASRPVAQWRADALHETDPVVAVQALLALTRVGDESDRRQALRRLAELPADAADRTASLARLRALAVGMARLELPVDDDLASRLTRQLDPRYPSGDEATDHELLHLLVHLGADVVARGLDRMAAMEVAAALDVAYALRLTTIGWDDALRERFFTWLGTAKTLEGGHSLVGYVEAIERDALARAPIELREALRARAAAPRRVLPDLDALRAAGMRAWTLPELMAIADHASKGRDFKNGAQTYERAVCATCHPFDGRGGNLGPDLTGVASRLSRRDLLRAIVEPSADVSDQYRYETLTLRSGETMVGRVIDERDGSIELAVGPFQAERARVRAADVTSRTTSTVSPMPPGLLGALTAEQVLDLLAFLESGGNPNHPAFER